MNLFIAAYNIMSCICQQEAISARDIDKEENKFCPGCMARQ